LKQFVRDIWREDHPVVSNPSTHIFGKPGSASGRVVKRRPAPFSEGSSRRANGGGARTRQSQSRITGASPLPAVRGISKYALIASPTDPVECVSAIVPDRDFAFHRPDELVLLLIRKRDVE
jgi:hypothetical protein